MADKNAPEDKNTSPNTEKALEEVEGMEQALKQELKMEEDAALRAEQKAAQDQDTADRDQEKFAHLPPDQAPQSFLPVNGQVVGADQPYQSLSGKTADNVAHEARSVTPPAKYAINPKNGEPMNPLAHPFTENPGHTIFQ